MALRPSSHNVENPVSARLRFSTFLLLGVLAGLMVACGGGGSASGGTTSGTQGAATLTWDPVTAANLSGYRIYYGTATGTYLQPYGQGVNVGNSTTTTVAGLNSGTRYHFVITAFDTSNNESGYSNEASKDIP